MSFIDTHTHLYDQQFAEDRTTMIERALSRGITTMLIPNVDLNTVDDMLAICKQYPANVFPMMGIHPCNVTEDWENDIQLIEQYLRYNPYIAVGEIGIDLYWDKTTFNRQRAAFMYQMTLAKELHLPVSIHSRDATAECIEVIAEHKLFTGGIFHCWGGTPGQAKQVIDMGFDLGIGGVLTFKNAGLPELIKEIGMEHIVLETDAPYLAPVPFRGKRNESAYIIEIAQKLAEVKRLTIEEIAEITSANAERVFKINNFVSAQNTQLK